MKETKEISHTDIEQSHLYLDLSEGLLTKIDLFLSNTNLDPKQQHQLIKLFEDVYGESYVNAITD